VRDTRVVGREHQVVAPHRQRLAVEVGRRDQVPDHHQHDAEQQRADAEHEDRADAEQRGRAVVLDGVELAGLEERAEQDQPAEQRYDAAHDEVARCLGQRAAVVPDAGEAGQPVVEGDHQPDCGDGVGQDVLADDGQRDVEGDRHAAVSHPQ